MAKRAPRHVHSDVRRTPLQRTIRKRSAEGQQTAPRSPTTAVRADQIPRRPCTARASRLSRAWQYITWERARPAAPCPRRPPSSGCRNPTSVVFPTCPGKTHDYPRFSQRQSKRIATDAGIAAGRHVALVLTIATGMSDGRRRGTYAEGWVVSAGAGWPSWRCTISPIVGSLQGHSNCSHRPAPTT